MQFPRKGSQRRLLWSCLGLLLSCEDNTFHKITSTCKIKVIYLSFCFDANPMADDELAFIASQFVAVDRIWPAVLALASNSYVSPSLSLLFLVFIVPRLIGKFTSYMMNKAKKGLSFSASSISLRQVKYLSVQYSSPEGVQLHISADEIRLMPRLLGFLYRENKINSPLRLSVSHLRLSAVLPDQQKEVAPAAKLAPSGGSWIQMQIVRVFAIIAAWLFELSADDVMVTLTAFVSLLVLNCVSHARVMQKCLSTPAMSSSTGLQCFALAY